MFRVEIDKGDYAPKKKVKYPYLAMTAGGKVVLAIKDSDSGNTCHCVVLRSSTDALKVGDTFNFDKASLVPLTEGKSVVFTNMWEMSDD